jgi:predicted lipoprotein
MWQKLKPGKPNIAIKQRFEPNVATMVETHSKLATTSIEVDNQMIVIRVQVGKNIAKDVFIDGGTIVNIITKNLIIKLIYPNQDQLYTTLEWWIGV